MIRTGLLGGISFVAILTTSLPAGAQTKASTPARTVYWKPNLAGIYSFSTITPLQRPQALAGKTTLND